MKEKTRKNLEARQLSESHRFPFLETGKEITQQQLDDWLGFFDEPAAPSSDSQSDSSDKELLLQNPFETLVETSSSSSSSSRVRNFSMRSSSAKRKKKIRLRKTKNQFLRNCATLTNFSSPV